jgi:hypothetical protein
MALKAPLGRSERSGVAKERLSGIYPLYHRMATQSVKACNFGFVFPNFATVCYSGGRRSDRSTFRSAQIKESRLAESGDGQRTVSVLYELNVPPGMPRPVYASTQIFIRQSVSSLKLT